MIKKGYDLTLYWSVRDDIGIALDPRFPATRTDQVQVDSCHYFHHVGIQFQTPKLPGLKY